MGVTYKLLPEIVEYVVEQKTSTPGLSCRQLSDLVSARFLRKISKSSVSNILKEYHLNSPVGRRGRGRSGGAKERFQIPQEKKQQIFGPDYKSTPPENPPSQQSASAPKPQAHSSGRAEKKASPPRPRKKPLAPPPPVLPSPVAPAAASFPADAPESLPAAIPVKMIEQTPVVESVPSRYDHMGGIFLKAAAWSVFDRPFLGPILAEHIRGIGLTDLDTAGDILLFLPAFGLDHPAALSTYTGDGLWALHGLGQRLDAETLQAVIDGIDDLQGLCLRLSIELPQVFKELNYIKLHLQNGKEIWLDAQFSSVWSRDVQLPLFAPLAKVAGDLARHLVNNRDPLMLCCAPEEREFAGPFYELLAACEGGEDRQIQTVGIFDEQHRLLSSFETIPLKKRNILAAFWPWQAGFSHLAALPIREASDSREMTFREEVFGIKEFMLNKQNSGLQLPNPLRAVAVFRPPAKEPSLIVAGNLSVEIPAEVLVRRYFDRWPILQDGFNQFVVRNQGLLAAAPADTTGSDANNCKSSVCDDSANDLSHVFSQDYDLMSLVKEVLQQLNNYVMAHYFPSLSGQETFAGMVKNFYCLDGTLRSSEERLEVVLSLPGNFRYRDVLTFAAQRVNESSVFDFQGRRLWIGWE